MGGVWLGAAKPLRFALLAVHTDEFRTEEHVIDPAKTVQTKAFSTHLRADDLFDPTVWPEYWKTGPTNQGIQRTR